MSEKYKVIDHTQPTFITITVTDWVDLFVRRVYTSILDDSLNYCIRHKGLVVHAYVYMTNHLHLIASSAGEELQNIIRDFKKYTSKQIIAAIKEYPESRREWLLNKFSYAAKRTGRSKYYKVWKDGFHPVLLDTIKKIEQRVHYIHYNPVEAGFVYEESAWVNSSYGAYTDDLTEALNVELKALW